MGYLTYYRLSLEPYDQCKIEKIIKKEDVLEDVFSDDTEAWAKWYDYRKDMLRVSRKYPGMTFRLDGEGESKGDTWTEYYKGGKFKCLVPTIIWPTFGDVPWEEVSPDAEHIDQV